MSIKQFLTILCIFGLLTMPTSCSRHYEQPLIIHAFPTNCGNTWKYVRQFYTICYDTVNNDTTVYLITDTLYEKFVAIDTIANWECYRLYRMHRYGYPFEIWWYAHPDTALLWIAYLMGYHSCITDTKSGKNLKFNYKGCVFNSIEELATFLSFRRYGIKFSHKQDTMYWDTPKKLFVYPLSIGKSWVAMQDPWIEKRRIVDIDYVEVPADRYKTLKMEIISEWMEDKESWYQWISKHGIIKDSLYIKGRLTDESGNEIGHFDAEEIYLLLAFSHTSTTISSSLSMK